MNIRADVGLLGDRVDGVSAVVVSRCTAINNEVSDEEF